MKILRFVIHCAAPNKHSRAIPERPEYCIHMTRPDKEVVGEFVYDQAICGIRSSDYRKAVKG